jgi:citrate lyase subunit beta/citryl-CoA lyase
MRKSLLFIPANSPAMLQNADIFNADGVIFDLEDAIHMMEKDAARDLLLSFFDHVKLKDIEVIIRINSVDSPFFSSDLDMVFSNLLSTRQIHTILLPKATTLDISILDQKLKAFEEKHSLSHPIGVIALIEKAYSLFEISVIAMYPRVTGLFLGAEDLATELEVERTLHGEEILLARQMIIYAAKAFGIDAIDTPFTDVTNEEGLIYDAKHAKALGMTGKSCIHPMQIDVINDIFQPSAKDIDFAHRVMAAYQDPNNQNKGVFSLDGKMIDKPIIERAKRILTKVKS